MGMVGSPGRGRYSVIASSAPAFGRPAWMKHALVCVAPGLPRFARNDGESSAQTSPRHCEALLRRGNPVFQHEMRGETGIDLLIPHPQERFPRIVPTRSHDAESWGRGVDPG